VPKKSSGQTASPLHLCAPAPLRLAFEAKAKELGKEKLSIQGRDGAR